MKYALLKYIFALDLVIWNNTTLIPCHNTVAVYLVAVHFTSTQYWTSCRVYYYCWRLL